MNEIFGKDKLKQYIFTTPRMTSNLLYLRFESNELETDYQKKKHKSFFYTRLLVELVIGLYYLLNAFISYKSYENIAFLVSTLLLSVIDIVLYLMHEKSEASHLLGFIPYLKLALNYIYFCSYDVFISFQLRYNMQTSLVRNFYIQQIILFFEYSFFISPSSLINKIIISGYVVTYSLFHVQETYYRDEVVLTADNCTCKNDSLFVAPEILTCIIMYAIFNSITIFEHNQRVLFCYIKQTQTFVNYFASFVNNLNSQFISVAGEDILLINSLLLKELSKVPNEYKDLGPSKLALDSKLFRKSFFPKKDGMLLKRSSNAYVDGNKDQESSQRAYEHYNLKNQNQNQLTQIQEYLSNFVILGSDTNISTNSGYTLFDSIINIISGLKEDSHGSNESDVYSFRKLGTFTNICKTRVFEVSYRIFPLQEFGNIFDFLIDDTTEIRNTENLSTKTKVQQQLFSKIAHEFKTPIIALVCLAKELLTQHLSGNQNGASPEYIKPDQLRLISNLSDYILYLVNDIIFCCEQNQMSFQIEQVSLKEIIEFADGVLQALVSVGNHQKKLELITNFDEDLYFVIVKSDKTRLKQVLINLISNSVKFTKSGEIKLEAKLSEEGVIISVSDTGIGMSSEELDKLRDKSDNPVIVNVDRNYNEMGSGMGVRIIKNILLNLSHELEIESHEKKGSTFKIIIRNFSFSDSWHLEKDKRGTLKTDRMNQESLTKLLQKDRTFIHHESIKLLSTSPLDLKSFRISSDISNQLLEELNNRPKILLVEDVAPLRRSLVKIVTESSVCKNYGLIEGCDGKDIIAEVINDQQNNKRICLIISDENMEYLCGSDAFKILRSLENQKKISNIFIISLTAFVDEDSKAKILNSGANMVLSKPLTKLSFEEAFSTFQFKYQLT